MNATSRDGAIGDTHTRSTTVAPGAFKCRGNSIARWHPAAAARYSSACTSTIPAVSPDWQMRTAGRTSKNQNSRCGGKIYAAPALLSVALFRHQPPNTQQERRTRPKDWDMYDKPRVATVLVPFSHAGEWHLTLAENELVLVMGEKVHCISGENCLLSTVLHEPNPCSPSPVPCSPVGISAREHHSPNSWAFSQPALSVSPSMSKNLSVCPRS